MNFYRNNWYYIGAIIFVFLAFFMGFFGDQFAMPQKVMLFSFMTLLIHQFEEYALPGGFPPTFNIVFSEESEYPDRYPLNRQSCLVVNVFMAYPFFIIAIIFPEWHWYGITVALFGFAQFVIHGILIPIKLKSFYNPGLGSTIFIWIPLGVFYLYYIQTHFNVQLWEWLTGILATPLAALFIVLLPVKLLRNKQSRFPFSVQEMKKFNIQKKIAGFRN